MPRLEENDKGPDVSAWPYLIVLQALLFKVLL
jgi:hypothetical protein